MRVIDVCSGIGTTAVAWHSLGWQHLCFAEIEKFPSAVLRHRWPNVPNEGNFTKIGSKYRGAADLLVGGTPCQSFSVAGLRGGLADDRGNLALEFLRLADRTRPRWVVWENVPGVLSSNGGRDFGSILGGLGQLGYGWAYRVLDAQHFGVPQRRRRVFVVGHLGDWRRAAAVLFERHSLQGDHPPRREARETIAGSLAARTRGGGGLGTDFECMGGLVPAGGSFDHAAEIAAPLTHNPYGDHESRESLLVAHSLRADGFDASEVVGPLVSGHTPNGHGCAGVNSQAVEAGHIIPILEAGARTGKSTDDIRAGIGIGEEGDPMFTLQSGKQHAVCDNSRRRGDSGPCVFQPRIARNGRGSPEEISPALNGANAGKTSDSRPCVMSGMAVRRLTPLECERLQGLPDRYTEVPFNGKMAADGPRYEAIGNGMAVPVIRWIGERVQQVEDMK